MYLGSLSVVYWMKMIDGLWRVMSSLPICYIDGFASIDLTVWDFNLQWIMGFHQLLNCWVCLDCINLQFYSDVDFDLTLLFRVLAWRWIIGFYKLLNWRLFLDCIILQLYSVVDFDLTLLFKVLAWQWIIGFHKLLNCWLYLDFIHLKLNSAVVFDLSLLFGILAWQ